MTHGHSRPVVPALLALSLVLAACSGHRSRRVIAATTTTSVADTTTSELPVTSTLPVTPETTTTAAVPATTAAASVPRPTTTARPAPTTTRAPSTTAATTTTAQVAAARVAARQIATLQAPDAMAARDGDAAVYVAERPGRIRRITGGQLDPTPVLDITSEVSTTSERGLLGVAFAPGGAKMYIDFTGTDGTIHVVEFAIQAGVAVNRREVISIDHRQYGNHNGGDLAFGPDAMLYISVGDGGSEGDPNHRGQALDTPLAKLLRIDPRAGGASAYQIPAGNPFASRPGARPEIWAYGLRNPWRFSFDRATGDLWIGDVGQDTYEEVDLARAGSKGGENYGWSLREGFHPYNGGARPADNVDPVYDYPHSSGGCAVTGGYVYRGKAVPALAGSYLFGDFCTGAVQALVLENGQAKVVNLNVHVPQLASFGQDAAGEVYALSLSGAVDQLVPA